MMERRRVRLGRRRLVILGALLLVLMLAATVGQRWAERHWLRPLVEREVSATLAGRLYVGDLDVSLPGGWARLDDVAIIPAGPDAERVVKARSLRVRLSRRALLHGEVKVAEVSVDRPEITLERQSTGEWGILHLFGAPDASASPTSPAVADAGSPGAPTPSATPSPEVEATPSATATAPPAAAPFILDRIRARDGRLVINDRTFPEAVSFAVEFPTADADHVVLAGDGGTTPITFRVAARVEGAPLTVAGEFHGAGEQPGLALDVDVEGLPLERGHLYAPDLGWQTLGGRLDAELHYVHDAGRRQVLSGDVTVHDVAIGIPGVERPVLAVSSIAASIEAVDVLGRRVAIRSLALQGPDLLLDVAPTVGLPLLAKGLPESEEDTGPPYTVTLAEASITDGTLRARVNGREEPVGVRLSARDLGSAPGARSQVDLGLALAGGSLGVRGAAGIDPPSFDGTVTLADLGLPLLLEAVQAAPPGTVTDGTLDGTLAVRVGRDAGLALDGALGLTALATGGTTPGATTLRLERLELANARLALPDMLAPPGAPPRGPTTAGGTVTVTKLGIARGADDAFAAEVTSLELADLALRVPPAPATTIVEMAKLAAVIPSLRLTRTPAGLVLPGSPVAAPMAVPAGSASTAEAAAPATSERAPAVPAPLRTASPEAAAARATSGETPATAAAPPTTVALGAVDLAIGTLRFEDRAVQPFFRGQLSQLTARATAVAWPAEHATGIDIRGKALGDAPVWLIGDLRPPGDSWLELNLAPIRLATLNPYATTYAGYVLRGGEGSLYSKISRGDFGLYARSWIELRNLDISGERGGESAFRDAVGIPLGAAVALLRDPRGIIGLDIPIDVDPKGAVSLRMGTIIQSAVRQAIIGALSSPLKALGMLVPSGGKGGAALAVDTIQAAPGSEEVAADDATQLDALANLLSERPGLRVALHGVTTPADVEGLRQRALLAALESGEGLPPDAEGLTRLPLRRRIRAALETRVAGEPAPLDPEDEQALAAWLGHFPAGPAELERLAAARAANVQRALESRYGVDPSRATVGAPHAVETGTPGVAVDLGS